MNKKHYVYLLAATFFLAAFFLIGPSVVKGKSPTSPDEVVKQAWDLALASGAYEYRTMIDQTTYPVPSLHHTGQSAQEDKLGLEGSIDLNHQEMNLILWPNGSFDPQRGIEVKVEAGQSYGRMGQGEWQEMDNIADLFAPGGDPFSFLTGIRDVQHLSQESYSFDHLNLDFSTYRFELDGHAFSNYLTKEMESKLLADGKLPHGISLATPQLYQDMTGFGQIWLSAEGLPARMEINMLLEPENGERIRVEIKTDYFGFDKEAIAKATTSLSEEPLVWLQSKGDIAATQTVPFFWLMIISGLFLSLVAKYWHTSQFYGILAVVIIFSMLLTPFWQGNQLEALSLEQVEAEEKSDRRAAMAKEQEAIQISQTAVNWNPNENPMETTPFTPSFLPTSLTEKSPQTLEEMNTFSLNATNNITSTDTDGDGLSDLDEDDWGTCSAAAGSIYCSGVLDPRDSDGDGLTDGAEIYQLGIVPTLVDSDGDLITDTLEVEGFTYNGKQWYLNPAEIDTNKDGLADGIECPPLSMMKEKLNVTGICPDTDGDGTPDPFDSDNDGDGILDRVDLSPNSVSQIYDEDNSFKLSVNNLQVDKPVIVNLQLRPTNPDHLTYSNLILDWPTNDDKGQIQRHLDTTFATTLNSDAQSNNFNSDYGDVRVIPMLEIKIPYTNGHYGNLPILPAYSGISRTLGMTVAQWLDTTELTPYGITVRDADETSGDLLVYLPLATVENSNNSGIAAFGTQMLYYPEQGTTGIVDWGSPHEMNVIWLVQMLTDECVVENPITHKCVAYQDKLNVVHIYDEAWTLTGLDISEEHGLDVAIIYEDPTLDDNFSFPDQLWMVGSNLNNNFLRGRDCPAMVALVCQSDGQRDVRVTNLATEIDNWSGGTDYIQVDTFNYIHHGHIADIMMNQLPAILDTQFTAYANETVPTIMVAHEMRSRSINLEDGGSFTDHLVLDLDPNNVSETIMASVTWNSYQYVNSSWENYDIEDYLTHLEASLTEDTQFTADVSNDLDELKGKLVWGQMYYLYYYRGATIIVEIDSEPVWTQAIDEMILEALYDTVWFDGGGDSGSQAASELFANQTFSNGNAGNGFFELQTEWSKFNLKLQNGYFTTKAARYLHLTDTISQGFALFTVYLTVAVIFLIAYNLLSGGGENSLANKITGIILAVSGLIMEILNMVLVITRVLVAINQAASTARALRAVWGVMKYASKFKWVSFASLIIEIAVIWGMVLFMLVTNKVKPNTIALDILYAFSIAATVIAIIFFIFSLNPIGLVLTFLLAIVEGILFLVGVEGVTEKLIEVLADAIYDVDQVIRNLDDSERFDIQVSKLLLSPTRGIVVGNSLHFEASVTNTVEFHGSSPESDADNSTFRYYLQGSPVDRHEDLSSKEMEGEWNSLPGRYIWTSSYITAENTILLNRAGINRWFTDTQYLTESFVAPYEGCWEIAGGEISCQLDYFKGSIHIGLGDNLYLDVLPETLAQFVSMKWNSSSISDAYVPTPPQTDIDGDGLLDDGTDPDPNKFDTDGDGLSDFYEISRGFNPLNADNDQDGLTDAEELALSTLPNHADADQDGLTDYIEVVQGWLVPYEDINGVMAVTRVWSNPYVKDTDGDGLNDMQEYVFGLNPWVESDPSIIRNIIQFDDFVIDESDAPELLLQFEEHIGADTFANSSIEGKYGSCTHLTDICPVAGNNGRYGSAITLDGTNDYLTVTNFFDAPQLSFSVGSWINIADNSQTQIVLSQENGSGTGRSWLRIDGGTGLLATNIGGSNLASSQPVPLNEWVHVAMSYDGTNLSLYINGALEAMTSLSTQSSIGHFHIGVSKSFGSHYSGILDELAIFDYGLSNGQVIDLMNGRYNPNDYITRPGQPLTYQATVTNTHLIQDAHGYLSAQSSYLEPEIGEPDLLLHFEQDEYVATFANSANEASTASCLADTTCPETGIDGQYQSGVYFDGADDLISFPSMGDRFTQESVAFWLNVSSLPAPGEKAYLLDTTREVSGVLDIYLDSNGQIIFEIDNVSTISTYCYYDTGGVLVDCDSPITITDHLSYYSFAGNLNKWVHVIFTYRDISNTRIYINGVQDSFAGYTATNPEIIVGPGFIGNDQTSSMAYHGKLDDFIVYNGVQLASPSASNPEVTWVYDGDYYQEPLSYAPLIPSFLLEFDDIGIVYDDMLFIDTQKISNHAYCTTVNRCPARTNWGFSGYAIHLDGVNDFIYTPGGSNDEPQDIDLRIRLDQLPADKAYILDTNSVLGEVVDIYINATGQIVAQRGAVLHTSVGTIPANSWQRIQVKYYEYTQSGNCYYDSEIRINGVLDSAHNYYLQASCGNNPTRVGPGRIGNSLDDAFPVDGRIDSFNFDDGNYPFDLIPSMEIGFLNDMNDAEGAFCEAIEQCPAIESNGRFSNAVRFDGNDYLITPNSLFDPETTDFTLAAWVNVDVLGATNHRILHQQDGTGIGRSWLTIDSSGELRSFIGGVTISTTNIVTAGQWHYVSLTYDKDSQLISLYLDGILDTAVIQPAESNEAPITIGVDKSFNSNFFTGMIDELFISSSLVEADGIQALMNSTYPAILIEKDLIPFTALSQTAVTTIGSARVNHTAVNSSHTFEEQAEAALELQSPLSIPVIDDNAANLIHLYAMEEIPSETTFIDLVSNDDASCMNDTCPLVGVRGKVGRALYFDGLNDSLDVDPFGSKEGRSWSVWVKADRGTILDTRTTHLGRGFQLDFNRFEIVIDAGSSELHQRTVNFTLPENEWVHLVATYDLATGTANVYINGVLAGSQMTPIESSSNYDFKLSRIGADVDSNDPLHGYLDDLRIYDIPLSVVDVQSLYNNSAPQLRFEFDEDSGSTTFADQSINGYVGQPKTELCAELTLDQLVVNSLAVDPSDLYIKLDGERLFELNDTHLGLFYSLNTSTLLCEMGSLSAGIILSGGAEIELGTTPLSVTVPGTVTQSFVLGADHLDLTWNLSDQLHYMTNPPAGSDGQIGNTALFNGEGYIEVEGVGPVASLTDSFTIMAWINPENIDRRGRIISTGRAMSSDDGYGLRIKSDNTIEFQTFGSPNQNFTSSTAVQSNIWQHVAIVFDSSYDVSFYIDGVLVDTVTGSNPATANLDDPLFIGAKTDSGGAMHQFFQGEIDELAVYSRELSNAEIYSIYLQELRWYRDYGRFQLQIDNDLPTINLLTTETQYANEYIQLAVQTIDPSTRISLLDFGLKAPSDGQFNWSTAPACLETAQSKVTWCPNFDPSFLDGEGVYQLQFRAVDQVGHETISPVYTIYVDDKAPIVSSAHSGEWGSLQEQATTDGLSWKLTLTGIITDPLLVSGDMGSGVYSGEFMTKTAVLVGLFNEQGELTTPGWQAVALAGNVWTSDYHFTVEKPSGLYTITVQAMDQVGNSVSEVVGTIKLDGREPIAEIQTDQISLLISTTMVISGVVHEIPDWGGDLVRLHFESMGSAITETVFYDYSDYGNHASCNNCPMIESGPFQDAVRFDGVTQYLSLPHIVNPLTTTFSAALWFNTDTIALRPLVQQENNGDFGRTWLGIDSTDKIYSYLGNNTLLGTTLLNTGEWYHAAVTYDGENVALYLNGQLETSAVRTMEVATGNMLIGVNKTLTNFFDGAVDELVIFDRALTAKEVHALAQKDHSGVAQTDISLTPHDFISSTQNYSWTTTSLASPSSAVSDWSYAFPTNLENYYDLSLKTTDQFGNESSSRTPWRGTIDLVPPRIVTFTIEYIGANTVYNFIVEDLALENSTLLHPCSSGDLVIVQDPTVPFTATNQISGSCSVLGYSLDSKTLSVCDVAGHCVSQTIEPKYCAADYDNDNITDYFTYDATAIQMAVDSAVDGSFIKVAGFCQGVQLRNGSWQSVYFDKGVVIEGGHDASNWAASFNGTTTISADNLGRVAYISSTTPVVLINLILTDGQAVQGANVYNQSEVVFENSIISNGQASTGGGIYNLGIAEIHSSSLLGNSSGGSGAAAYNMFGKMRLLNSTVSNNRTNWNGGAVLNQGGFLTITHSTIVSNVADYEQDGNGTAAILSWNGGTAYLESTIVAGNSVSQTVNHPQADCSGLNLDGGYNLVGISTGCNNSSGTTISITPTVLSIVLSLTLDFYGGRTPHYALKVGSPAIDLIPATVNGCGTFNSVDQRLSSRPAGVHCDIGAHEYVGPDPAAPFNLTIAHTAGTVANLSWSDQPSNCVYDLQRSNTPYSGYAPYISGLTVIADDDLVGIGDAVTNYYYYVTAFGCGNLTIVDSNLVGEFDFAIVPGS